MATAKYDKSSRQDKSEPNRDVAQFAVGSDGCEQWVDVPVIDVSALLNGEKSPQAWQEVVSAIKAACGQEGLGFFYAKHHGVDVHKHEELTARFHKSITDEEKRRIAVVNYNKDNCRQTRAGYYLPVPGKKAQESFCLLNPNFTTEHPLIATPTPLHEVNLWPDNITFKSEFRKEQESHYFAMLQLSEALLRAFALALGEREEFFEEKFSADTTLSALSLIRYPTADQTDYPPLKVAADGTLLSFDDHYDVSLLTILYQSSVANLQVFMRDGVWRSVPANNECFLVNGGNFMELMSRGLFPTPLHRVKFVPDERFSIPFFVHLSGKTDLRHYLTEPQSSTADEQPRDQQRWTYGELMQDSFAALIKKNGHT